MKISIPVVLFLTIASGLSAATTWTNEEVSLATLSSSTGGDRVYNILEDGYACTTFEGQTVIVGETNVLFSSFNSLTVRTGATLVSEGGEIGEGATFGGRGAHNVVTITDDGSRWDCVKSLYVGLYGCDNLLRIENGGFLTAEKLSIGEGWSRNSALGSRNKVIVRGTGSTIDTTGECVIGDFGRNNAILVADGGVANCGDAVLGLEYWNCNGNHLLVTGTGSQFTASGTVTVGDTGSNNTITVSNGGLLTCFDFTIPEAHDNTNNSATVIGQGSQIRAVTSIVVGENGQRRHPDPRKRRTRKSLRHHDRPYRPRLHSPCGRLSGREWRSSTGARRPCGERADPHLQGVRR